MCRLFGFLSNAGNFDLSADLLQSPCSLYVQSQANPQRKQTDGWGIAWYRNGTAHVSKSGRSIFKEEGKLKHLIEKLRCPPHPPLSPGGERVSILGHIRHASNPLGINKNQLIGLQHSQPFIHHEYAFVHNGSLNIPLQILDRLGQFRGKVRGRNDSEILFWLLMRKIEEGKGNVLLAFQESLKEIRSLWAGLPSKARPARAYSGLNIILSNGRELWALCKYDGVKPWLDSSLTNLERSTFFEMRYYCNSDMVKVASERTTLGQGWKPLKDGTILRAWISKEGDLRSPHCLIKSLSII